MLRTLENNLVQQNGSYYHNDQPYYGYSYKFDDKGIFHAIYKIVNGKKVDLLDEKPIAEPGEITVGSHHLKDTGEVDEDGEPIYTYQGQLFDGVAYMFNQDGKLLRLASFDEGEEYTHCTYYLSGLLETKETLFEEYEWYESGQLKKKKVRNSTSNYIFIIHLSQHGRIQWISLESEYNDFNELTLLTFDKTTRWSSSGVNDSVFEKLADRQSFNTIQELSLTYTNITGSILLKFMNDNIRRLDLDDNNFITQEDVDKIQELFPSCDITFFPKKGT